MKFIVTKARCTPVDSCSFEHQVKYVLARFHPNFKGEHLGVGQGPPTSLPLSPTSQEDLRLDGYLEYPHASKVLYICKHPCLLQDSSPGPTAAVSVTNHYTGWTTRTANAFG
ncbi:uncharacterized protein TNCV_977141 [Trichonephila clavipes]|nr:uncharacterized protein TNCV_977141 [Trichonephila clavipes]